ncbi:MAG TPA: hypothetical protein VGE76_09740, partial [Opitutaceae bacterium]
MRTSTIRFFRGCGSLALFFLLVARGLAAEGLRAGAARVEITPEVAMLNWNTLRPYGAVHDPVFARAVVLDDGATRIAFVGWDMLDAREYAVARVRRAISGATGIPEAHIIVHATHNHSGPKSEMGPEPVLPKEQVKSRPAQQHPVYRAWADALVEKCVALVRQADAAAVPVSLWLGRAHVGEWLFNRRPVKPDGTVQTMMVPADPLALPAGLRFGPVDPTATVLSLRGAEGRSVATFFHLTAHAVAVYGAYPGVSADWPGAAMQALRTDLGGEAFFLQGCAGDIVPARRGLDAAMTMGQGIAARVAKASKLAVKLPAAALRTWTTTLELPTTPEAAVTMKRPTLSAEVQLVTCGPLALVTLPGEPLLELATAIQAGSPYPHTLVLGYTNGRGVGYVGL